MKKWHTWKKKQVATLISINLKPLTPAIQLPKIMVHYVFQVYIFSSLWYCIVMYGSKQTSCRNLEVSNWLGVYAAKALKQTKLFNQEEVGSFLEGSKKKQKNTYKMTMTSVLSGPRLSPSLLISCTKWLFNPRSEKRHRFSSSNIRNRSQISTSWSSHGGCSWRREQQIVNRSWKVKSQQKHQDEHTQEK